MKSPGADRPALQLVAFAAASLYFELGLIRFTSAEVLYLGYFSNFMLVSAFVGLGLGFIATKREGHILAALPFSLLFLVAIVEVALADVGFLRDLGTLFYFGNRVGRSAIPGPALLLLVFVPTVTIFCGIGQQIGKLFGRFSSLRAYTLDVAGSLLGITVFSLQATIWSSPITWLATGTALLVVGAAAGHATRALASHLAVGGFAAIAILLATLPNHQTIWSTYQKLELVRNAQGTGIYANGVVHQFLVDAESAAPTYYGQAYREHLAKPGAALDDVLVIGAGSGTDVSVALAAGAKSIDAVEIDPGILALGQQHHPSRPYDDPRVHLHNTDGRAFLHNSTKKYDLVVFALPDSLLLLSPMSSIRLESYLFTMESFAEVKAHLKPAGSFALYNQYRWDWLRNKIGSMLEDTFGGAPLRSEQGVTTLFLAGPGVKAAAPSPRDGFVGQATDDWPFVYLRTPSIHWAFVGMIAMFLVVSFVGVMLLAPRGVMSRPDLPFFFMGAAFLLLETKSIAFFSLLFGSTWVVNSLAFGGVLVSVLAANLLVSRVKIERRGVLFGGLVVALVVAYACPPSMLLGLESLPLRYALGVVLAFLPIFFANVIFSREFASSEESTRAFGWNLLGAVAGGGLEYLSLVLGYRNLFVLVAACYLVAALALRRRELAARPSPA